VGALGLLKTTKPHGFKAVLIQLSLFILNVLPIQLLEEEVSFLTAARQLPSPSSAGPFGIWLPFFNALLPRLQLGVVFADETPRAHSLGRGAIVCLVLVIPE
jgi:hypothetical protein